jgi:hypothetical protein
MKKILDSEKGSLIVEATIVFPVTFLVVIFLIFVGNLYYQRSKAQAIFTETVVEYAAKESNPMLEKYLDDEAIPAISSGNDFEPYRYLNFGDRTSEVSGKIESGLKGMGTGLFSGMDAKSVSVTVKYKTYGVYAKVEADMNYSIAMPVKLLGQSEASKVKFSEYIEVPAMEGSEMVRNVNMVRDFIDRNETASNVMSKAQTYITKFKSITN